MKQALPARPFVFGIDASNLLGGGGRTHLVELLSEITAGDHRVGRIIVWGDRETLALLPDNPLLEKVDLTISARSIVHRLCWQTFLLPAEARERHCDVLFVPGSLFLGDFRPFVTMSQNILPFDFMEMRRFGLSATTLRLLILRIVQTMTFRRADGIIFLSKFAQRLIVSNIGGIEGRACVVPHGVGNGFFLAPRAPRPLSACSRARPFRIVYVSIVDQYKHQWNVVRAVNAVRLRTGAPLTLELVGPGQNAPLRRLKRAMAECDPAGEWVFYRGPVDNGRLPEIYESADMAVFASSCENLPIVLLEKMASGLPIASSNRGPMPEVLKDGGGFFDPESIDEIADTIESMVRSDSLRGALSIRSFEIAKQYRWAQAAAETLGFARLVAAL